MFPDSSSGLAHAAVGGLNRRQLLGFALLAALPPAAYGADLSGADAPATVMRFYDELLADMKAGRNTAFQQRFEMLTPAVDRAFDLQTVLAVSVGPRWSGLPAEAQARLLAAFRRYTVASYVASFDSYAGQIFAVSPDVRPIGTDQVVVRSRIAAADGVATKLDYLMKLSPAGWKVVDVLADGSISRVAVQRSDFRGVLANGGGDALLACLQRKTSELSGGNLA